MGREAKLAKCGLKEGALLAIVGLSKVEDDRDVGTDVDSLDGGDRSRRELGLVGVGGGGGVDRGSHGGLGCGSKGVFQVGGGGGVDRGAMEDSDAEAKGFSRVENAVSDTM
jgi:hypothetical protein